MTLLYSKRRHFAKHKTICVTFLYKKPDTLRYAIFYGILEIGEGGRDIFIGKKLCTLCYIFICKKQCTLRYVFIYKKPDTLRYIFIRKNDICVTFLYLKFIERY